MDPLTMGLITGGVGALSGVLQYQGNRETNASNESMAANATSANMAEAQRNRDFQQSSANTQMAFQANQIAQQRQYETGMSNTAHQREVNDLIKAGLNPLLSVNGGASTPSTGAASGAAASGAQGSAEKSTNINPWTGVNPMSVISSAIETMGTVQGLEKQKAETNFINAQAKKTGVDTKVAEKGIPASDITNEVYDVIRPLIQDAKKYWLPKYQQRKQNNAIKSFRLN